jgi:PHD/YefM family antitoxin component YafN of YafNO toxin-antitoxin module
MTITTMTSREFNQDVSKAKRASFVGPVVITDRGHAAHVLLTMKEYESLTGKRENIIDLLAMPELAEIEFEPKKMVQVFKPAEFD